MQDKERKARKEAEELVHRAAVHMALEGQVPSKAFLAAQVELMTLELLEDL